MKYLHSMLKTKNKIFLNLLMAIIVLAAPNTAYAQYNPKASSVRILDAGGYYEGNTVEDALQELGSGTNWDQAISEINWELVDEDLLTGINWPYYSQGSGTNWDQAISEINWELVDEDLLTGINWPAYEGGSAFSYSKIEFVVDGGGTTIETGSSGHKVIPFNCTITAWEIVSTASGSAVVDIKKSTYATFDTFNSIAGSEKPTLSSASKNTDTSLSTWTTSISAGDRIQAYVDSADITGVVVVTLYVTKI